MNDANEANKVHSSTLRNGVNYSLYAVEGFAGRAELALKIEGKVLFVMTIDTRRTGNIVCKPTQSRELLIKRSQEGQEEPEVEEMDLSDVVPSPDDI